ncbi:MAG: hypothetical protein JST66_08625 [Bacteroidetes bacterium]|nr:hypothetical protein [Bacteroidota bacterium]
MKYFALAMSAVYVLAGCAFLFTDALVQFIPRFRLPIGLVLVGYGILRFFLWRRKYAQHPGDE